VVADPRARAIIDELIAPDRQSLDVEVVRAEEEGISRAIASLMQVGMFSAGRCVWIRGLGAENAEESERLLAFLSTALPADSSLVATSNRIDQRSRLFKWFRSRDSVEDLAIPADKRGRLRDEELDQFVRRRVESNGLPAPSAAVLGAIRARASQEIGELAQEVDKLCIACASNGTVTVTDVRTHVRDCSAAWVFDLTNALSERRLERASVLVEQLLAQGEPPIRLVAVLAGHVSDLLEAARALPAVPPNALRNAGAFARSYFPKLPDEVRNRFKSGFRAYYAFQGASAFRIHELRSLHRWLVDADLALKSSRMPPQQLLASIVQRACTVTNT
jgi:DNA polymerase-3 subunit delta